LETWNRPEDAPQRLRQGDRLELTEKFKNFHSNKKLEKLNIDLNEASLDPKLMSIIRALEALTGRKINISNFQNLKNSNENINPSESKTPQEGETQRVGWGIDYRYEKTEIKEENLNFSAQGNVKTEDGKSIDFSLALSMKNSIKSHESISLKAGDALIDPLVLNFGSNTVSISDVKHSFDLDLDGKSEEFSFVGDGSGFLALDKNKDSKINDGSELFGPTKGNGFNELSAYDSDSNGWIDENDDVFADLLIWTKDENGVENLYSLQDKGVGALYLDSISSEFELMGSDSTQKAQMRESSVYLGEDGSVGTLQEIDLVV